MRRSDREITDFEEIIKIMEKCDVCRLALNNEEGYPYILPLNFGMQLENGQAVLYFHGAKEGKKYELMEKDPRVSFEMDCAHKLVMNKENGSCTMEYESVIGQGKIEFIPKEETYHALKILMKHYHQEEFPFNLEVMKKTKVFRLIVETVNGKARKVKKGN